MQDFFTQAQIAYHQLVKEFPGGSRALAPLVGMNPGTLSNKVNPNIDTHHLSAAEGVAIQAASQNFEPIKADATTLGGVFTRLPPIPKDIDDEKILTLYLELQEEQGETAQKIREALEDGAVSARELRGITKEAFEDIAKQRELLEALTQLSKNGSRTQIGGK